MFGYLQNAINHARKVEAHILHLQRQVNEFSLRQYSYEDVCAAVQKYCQEYGVETLDADLPRIIKYLDH